MDKEHFSLSVDNRGHDGLIGSLLSHIEHDYTLLSLVPLSSWIIGTLLGNKIVANDLLPLATDLWHVCEVGQSFGATLLEDLITKEKAKVIDLILCRLRDVIPCPEAVFQVITYVCLKLIPQCCGIGGSAEEQDGHKKAAQLAASLHPSCFLKALSPLRIILKKATCQAGCLEGRIFNALKAPEFYKRLGAFDYHEQHAHIKALSCIGSNKVESANGSASLTYLPFFISLHPDIVLGEVDVEVFMGRLINSIGLKVGHELGLGVVGPLHDLLRKGLIIECDQLLIRKVDGEVNHSRLLMVDFMSHDSPDSLIATHIASIQVLFNLICNLTKLHSSAVMALVDIFMDVFDTTHTKGQLHIDMTLKVEDEIGHIGDHPLVVKFSTTYVMFLSIIFAMIMRVAIHI